MKTLRLFILFFVIEIFTLNLITEEKERNFPLRNISPVYLNLM